MSNVLEPPPTWALPVIEDPRTKESQFNPIWLKWFVDLAAILTGVGGSSPNHNLLSGLQGGSNSPAQYYHLTQAQNTTVGNIALTSGKSLTVDNTLEFAGTDSTKMTFPGTSASIARTDAGQTFTGTQTFSSTIVGSINGNAATITNQGAWATMVTAYGSQYLTTDTAVSITVSGTWYDVASNMAAGDGLLNITQQNSKELKVTNAGTYFVAWGMAVSGTSGDMIHGTVGVNGTANTKLASHTIAKNTASASSIAGTGILVLSANDLVRLMVTDTTGTNTVTVNHATMSMVRVA